MPTQLIGELMKVIGRCGRTSFLYLTCPMIYLEYCPDSVQEVADSGDAAGSDVENEMAMNNLKNALMSSDSDSDHVLPPRRVLRRQAKLSPSKRVKSKENKTERKLTQQEKQLRQLNPAQQR